ncbi:hypothetical protein NKG99_20565 [Mesorhizobium sp. M1409]|uniref:hypothetical protein n=1 Tax=Mesorhizobium sp. M1409 TaxID=2957100 RepID=UPI0033373E3E
MNDHVVLRAFPVPIPARMRGLPVDRRGYPVPKFVEWIDGEPDFRIMNPEHLTKCYAFKRCWICGEPLGSRQAFVLGPMCCVNRISPEPPSHHECAKFAAQVCPFLSMPQAKRPNRPMPKGSVKPAGEMLEHNPGVTALWVTKAYDVKRVGHGVLFEIGEPERVEFFHKGRKATRAEIDAGINKGYPKLEASARTQGSWALRELGRQRARFERMLDAMEHAA